MYPLLAAQKNQEKKKRLASEVNADTAHSNQNELSAREIFENKKKEFVRQNQHDFAHANWDALVQSYQEYVKITSENAFEPKDDSMVLTQWRTEKIRKLRQDEEENKRCYMLKMLNDKSLPTPLDFLDVMPNLRPRLAILDYYQILLLWRAGRYQDVLLLSQKMVLHVHQHYSTFIHHKTCPLLPYYDAITDEIIEKYQLHAMINYLPLSEIYYYHAKSLEKLGKNSKDYFAMCYYFRAYNATAINLLPQAKVYIDHTLNLVNSQVEYKSLNDFISFLQKDNTDKDCVFVHKNTKFCAEYFLFTLHNKNYNQKLLDLLSKKLPSDPILLETKLLIYYAHIVIDSGGALLNPNQQENIQNFMALYYQLENKIPYEQYYQHVISLNKNVIMQSELTANSHKKLK